MFVVNVEGAIRRNEKWLLIRRSEKEEHAGGGLSLVGGKCEIEGDSSDILERTLKREVFEEEGRVYTEKYARDVVAMYNKNTWLSGHSVGDTITVYGRDYPIGEDGHIHVPTEGFWSNEKCTY